MCVYAMPFIARMLTVAAEKIVKVPDMAESITEGTLKQWAKRKIARGDSYATIVDTLSEIGDYVEQDEEIATIETDKACASYNFTPINLRGVD